jgi:SAM-dependent methyltransferase
MAWDSGSAYEMFMGRWSRQVASIFVAALEADPGLRWLDVGCGTGALTASIVDLARPVAVDGVDASPAFIEEAQRALSGAVEFQVASGEVLPFPASTFDFVVSGLALNFMPEPARALVEWARVARPGGRVAVYVWDYAGRMGFLREFWDVVAKLDPAGALQDQAERFTICRPDVLASAFVGAGLSDVDVSSIEISTHFTSFDDYWQPFLAGVGPAGAYLSGLTAAERARLAAALEQALTPDDDGSIELPARAWTAGGTV